MLLASCRVFIWPLGHAAKYKLPQDHETTSSYKYLWPYQLSKPVPLLFLISVIKRKEKNPLNDNSVVAEGQLQKGKRAELYMTMEKSSAESFAK